MSMSNKITLKQNLIKSKKAIILAVICVLTVTPLIAKADNHSFTFQFNDTSTTYSTDSYSKSDNDQSWYISIKNVLLANMSSSNVFGCKMHRTTSDSVDVYHTFSNYVSSYKIAYKSSVAKGDKMYLSAKKDDSSTSSSALWVTGTFAP